jgi:hypothetical protein
MKLVAMVQRPTHPDEAVRAVADAAGLTLAEARMRLAPEPPAVLARLEAEKAGALVNALRKAGLAALAIDLPAPSDNERTVARSVRLDDTGLTIEPRAGAGDPLEIAWSDVAAVLRAVRSSRAESETTEKSRRLALGTAIMTGGLKMTRTHEKRVHASEEAVEQVIFVIARSGTCAMLAESRLDFSCLGHGMQPSSTANMLEITRRLRERAKDALYDERLVRLGRRPLPFLATTDVRVQSGSTKTTVTDTSGTLDVLVEIMHQGLREGLIP